MTAEKRCTACGETKSLEAFFKSRWGTHGRESRCKACRAQQRKLRDERRGEAQRQRWRELQRDIYWKDPVRKRHVRSRYPRQKYEVRMALEPEKMAARRLLREAVRCGRVIKPAKCERCGAADRLEGHHPDYSKPLDVEWLCKVCHGRAHRIDYALRSEAAPREEEVCPKCGSDLGHFVNCPDGIAFTREPAAAPTPTEVERGS